MKNHLSNFTQDFLRKLDSARRSRAGVGVLLAVSLLATASAQTIKPLYGAHDGGIYASVLYSQAAAIAPLDLASRPGWVVTAACHPIAGPNVTRLKIAVWQDTGTALVLQGSHTSAKINCSIGLAVASLSNTSAQGDTTVVAATIGVAGELVISAWQVSASGAISRLGTPALDSTDAPLGLAITPLGSNRVVTSIETDTSALKVTAWDVPSTGDVTELGSAVLPNFLAGSITQLSPSQVVTAGLNPSDVDMAVISWGIDGAGTVTQQGSATTSCSVYGIPAIAPYLLASDAQVITGCLDSFTNLRFNTWGVTSTGTVTQRTNLTRPSMAESPAISFIPGDDLPFIAEYGSNNVFDALVFYQSGLDLEELTSYHTARVNYFPESQGVAPENEHRVVTAAENYNVCGKHGCRLALEVWYFDSGVNIQ